MTINAPNPGNYQQNLSLIAVGLRNAFQAIIIQNDYLTAQGGATFLTTVIGLSTADAAVVVSTLGNLAALAAIYAGGTPGAALNYQANSEPLWGGN